MRTWLVVGVLATTMAASCSSGNPPGPSDTATPGAPSPGASSPLPQGSDKVALDPAQFTADIDHPFWPMKPGSRWLYRETGADGSVQRVEVTVTDQTRTIIGITARVVHDVVTEDGQLIEDTYDWYGQDAIGNLWYLGEDTKEYEDGKVVSTEGSWEAGVDGAQPGIILPAQPTVGLTYRQEYYEGHAEDGAEVVSLDETAKVPAGSYDHLLETRDFTPLEPSAIEHKFYARGVGQVLALGPGSADREELISFHLA